MGGSSIEPPDPPKVPASDDDEADKERDRQRRMAALSTGRSSTIVTGGLGLTTQAPVSRPTLGSG